MDLRGMLTRVPENKVENPIYLEKDFSVDDALLEELQARMIDGNETKIQLKPKHLLNNRNKSVGGQLAIDMERMLNHQLDELPAGALAESRGRRFFAPGAVHVFTEGSAGQSYGAFCNDGLTMEHTGTCNDGGRQGRLWWSDCRSSPFRGRHC